MCAVLLKPMYGTRNAASNWENFSAHAAREHAGFTIGQASPCLMYNPTLRVGMYKNGGDFVLKGKKEKFEEARDLLARQITLETKRHLRFRQRRGT